MKLKKYTPHKKRLQVALNGTPDFWEAKDNDTVPHGLPQRTEAGGFTRAEIAKFGVPWPPPKGWYQELKKKHVSDEKQRVRREYEEECRKIGVEP